MYKLTGLLVVLFSVCAQLSYGQESVKTEAAPSEESFLPSALLEGVIGGDFNAINKAIDDGESIDLVNGNGWSAARFAVASGDLDMLHFLIDREIDLNQADNEGYTPLMVAASQSDKDMVEALLAGNANPLQKTANGDTAHSEAILAGRKVVALLIAEASALHAMEQEDSKTLLEALNNGAYVNIRNGAGWTPLMYAASRGELETVNAILTLGADANRNENDGWTALHLAAAGGHVTTVEALLKANTDYTIRNNKNQTARDVAAGLGLKAVEDVIPVNPAQDL